MSEEGVPRADQDEAVDEDTLAEEDVTEIIELDEAPEDDDSLALDVEDMNLQPDDITDTPPDDSTVTFDKHTGSVFCIELDPVSASLAVTGGEDDTAYVWNVADGSVKFQCQGHKDSVTCVSFSHDATMVATGDMSGIIKVWSMDTGQEVWSFEVGDIEWLMWHFGSHVLLAGTKVGEVWVWRIPSGDCKTFQGHGVTCGAAKLMADGKRLVAGYEDGSIKVWDIKTAATVHSFTGNHGHRGEVTCLDCHQDNNLVMSGSTDCRSKVISANGGKVLYTLDCRLTAKPKTKINPESGEGSSPEEDDESVEAVGFCAVQSMAATGTLSGSLVIWDIRTQVARHQCKHEAGIVRLKWDYTSPVVYTATLDGVVHAWDARTGGNTGKWFGHTSEILDMTISRDGSVIATASGDNTAKIFTTQVPER